MNNYELAAVLKVAADDAAQQAAVEKIKGFVTANNGNIEDVKEVGKRDLAYEIAKNKEGYYVYLTFTAPSNSIRPIEDICKIEESLLRHMIIKK